MAFPVVESRSSGYLAIGSTSHPITLPAGIEVGDLLVCVFSIDKAVTCTDDSATWTKLGQESEGTAVTGAIFYKIATGSDALTITSDPAEESSHIVLRISGADTPITGTSLTGTGVNANPPEHDAGEEDDYLWLVTLSSDSSDVITGAPINYNNFLVKQGSASGVSSATGERELTASSEDPGVWASPDEQHVCYTIAIAPAEAPPPTAKDFAMFMNI